MGISVFIFPGFGAECGGDQQVSLTGSRGGVLGVGMEQRWPGAAQSEASKQSTV